MVVFELEKTAENITPAERRKSPKPHRVTRGSVSPAVRKNG